MVLQDFIDVHASEATFFEFFEGMCHERYLGWHPDHRHFRWISNPGIKPGNCFHFEEVIAGQLLKRTVRVNRIEPGRYIACVPTSWLVRLFLRRFVFRTEVIDSRAYRFIAEISLRIGPIGARLKKHELDAVRAHMRIEGLNFKRYAEGHLTVA